MEECWICKRNIEEVEEVFNSVKGIDEDNETVKTNLQDEQFFDEIDKKEKNPVFVCDVCLQLVGRIAYWHNTKVLREDMQEEIEAFKDNIKINVEVE